MAELVSIIIPTYNSKALVSQAIDSCLAQTYRPLEIIVIDDGSTDGTGEYLQATYGDQIRYLYQENTGPGIARNRGIEAAQGAYIKFCDADDQLHPEHLARVMDVFNAARDEVAVVYTRFRYVGADGTTPLTMSDPPLLSGAVFCELLRSNGTAILTSTTTVRKAALIEVGLFPDDKTLRHAEDWDLFLRLAAQYQYAHVAAILLDYRVHEGGLTADTYASARGRLRIIQKARHYHGREQCLDDRAYDALEASRHHVVAMHEWQHGNRQAARQHLQAALNLTTQSAMIRRIYWGMSYILPYGAVTMLNSLLQRLQR